MHDYGCQHTKAMGFSTRQIGHVPRVDRAFMRAPMMRWRFAAWAA
jgi:hypothetical protein